jgi:hypothetical protein
VLQANDRACTSVRSADCCNRTPVTKVRRATSYYIAAVNHICLSAAAPECSSRFPPSSSAPFPGTGTYTITRATTVRGCCTLATMSMSYLWEMVFLISFGNSA